MATEKRLIDANALLIEYCQSNGCNEVIDEICPNCFTVSLIANAPTVDSVEVVRGSWIIDKSFMPFICTCSECGASYDIDGAFAWKYCPECGSKMDKEN